MSANSKDEESNSRARNGGSEAGCGRQGAMAIRLPAARPSGSGYPAGLRPRFAHRASFYKYCKARLTRALAPHWSGRRAALKALVRRVIGARRRDVRFLSGLLRAAAAPALLAALLLSLPAQHAQANPACTLSFVQRTGADNPFANIFAGTDLITAQWSAPTFGDWDSDGDLDALIAIRSANFPPATGGGPQPIVQSQFYENDGDAVGPHWTNITTASNGFYGMSGYQNCLTDLDGDGDLDIVAVVFGAAKSYFENTGTAAFPVFEERTGGANPVSGAMISDYDTPTLADLDGDGDADLIVGRDNGRFRYFENTGTAVAPAFTEQTGGANPLDGIDVGGYAREGFGDIDGDGDLDLIAGNEAGQIRLIENTGTATAPAFTLLAGAANPFDGVDVGSYAAPAFTDVDGDGDLDVVIGEQDGNLNYFENVSPKATPAFTELTGASNPLDFIVTGGYASPALADADGDGDRDLVVGRDVALKANVSDELRYYQNTGSAVSPVFVEQTGAANPFDKDVFSPSSPVFADLDADGDLDGLIGEVDGNVRYLLNNGTGVAPTFSLITGGTRPITANFGSYATCAFVDIDGDGDADVFVGADGGGIRYFENTGSAINEEMTSRTGAANPLNVTGTNGGNAPRFFDFDSDGDMDALSGRNDGTLRYFENTGNALAPEFEQRTGVQNPFDGVDAGEYARPDIADLNGDGLPEVIVGNLAGNFRYFTALPDCTPPVAVCQDITVELDASGNIVIDAAALDGGSTDNLSALTFAADPDVLSCADLGANLVTLTVFDGGGLPDSCTATVTVQDTTPPVIVLNGDAAPAIDCKSTFTDPGTTLTEACDAGASVVVGGDTVDITTPGDYILTYDAMDASGNVAAQVTRNVTVLDNCTTLTVDGGGGTVTTTAGEFITLAVEVNDANGGITNTQWYYDDGSKAAAPITDGGNFNGANTTTLLINPVVLENAGDYYCEVSDDFDTAVSGTFSLVVNAALSALGGAGMAALAALVALTGIGRTGRRASR